ncbi:hypothetical protein ABG79_00294 [Caloramator mitchellensis]|uniref:Uncharacterized protein n=1 Tax=Caloramator mitchellensis TaxID=908809 RepID=A0A0R3K0R3_CALMK|nr:hypothetical protein [Caloramator mitchellensis]KRQ88125.1 hypothetical protein ABG79_00294 [Caloramator mitchellensis]
MKESKYINTLFSEQEEIEAGLLKDLTLEPPYNLHEAVMRNIKTKENKLIRRFNFKKYLSVAAAIVIFVAGAGRMVYVGLEKEKEVNIVAQQEVNKEINTAKDNNDLAVALDNSNTKIQNNTNNTTQTKKETTKATKNTVKQNTEKPKKSIEKSDVDSNTTKVAVAQNNNISSTAEHNNNVLNTLSQGNITYSYELYYSERDINLLDYLKSNSQVISSELYSFTPEKFEEFKQYVDNNKLELKSLQISQQDSQQNEIVIRLIKK